MGRLTHDLSQACKVADTHLWDAHGRSASGDFRGTWPGRLVFPKYHGERTGPLRVSEQEARFAFVDGLSSGTFLYAAEAPTSKLFQFTGNKGLSAKADLALYAQDGQRTCNVEFKAKGVSPAAKSHFPIYKDFQKLLREPVWGLWFHLLESVNNSTISGLLKVMADEISNVQRGYAGDIESPGLTVHVCVLQHQFSLHKDLASAPDGGVEMEALGQQLSVDLLVSKSKLRKVEELNGWELHQYGRP